MPAVDKYIVVYICFWKLCIELFNAGLKIVGSSTVRVLYIALELGH